MDRAECRSIGKAHHRKRQGLLWRLNVSGMSRVTNKIHWVIAAIGRENRMEARLRWAKSAQNRSPQDACLLEMCPRAVRLALMSRWRMPKWVGRAVVRSCFPPIVLTKSMMGNDSQKTQLNAHWFKQRGCFSLLKCFIFYLISCDYLFKLYMNIPKHYANAISVWDAPYF